MSDRHTFERVYVDHYDAVLRYCLRRSDREDALDATAETFAVAWQPRSDMPVGRELPWPYGVARRVLANQRLSVSHDIFGFDANARSWTTCFGIPDDTYTGGFPFPALVGDPVNNRLVVINPSASALATVSRFGAIDLATGEWTQLLAPSDQ